MIYVLVDGAETLLGQVRYDRHGETVEIDVSIDGRYRGRGLGRRLLRETLPRISARWPGATVEAHVKESNHPSRQCFLASGFVGSGACARHAGCQVYARIGCPFAEVLFRCDGGGIMGMGHIQRCLALASAFARRGVSRCSFVARPGDGLAGARIEEVGFPIEHVPAASDSAEAAWFAQFARNRSRPVLVVMDSYELGAGYVTALRDPGIWTMVIHDFPSQEIGADFFLNPNLGADLESVRTSKATKSILGASYILLRDEFRSVLPVDLDIEEVARRILVTFGASDPGDGTARVLAALDAVEDSSLQDLEVTLIMGGAYPYEEGLRARVAASRHEIRLRRNVPDIWRYMREADLAITSGGSTCYEVAAMGLPHLILGTGPDQRIVAEGLHRWGSAQFAGWIDRIEDRDIRSAFERVALDPELRRRMSFRGRALVDGCGADRVVEEICRTPEATVS